MKKFILTLLLPTLVMAAFAQKTEEAGQKSSALVFFSDEVPRYTGIAVGAHLLNQYALGDWADFATANLGAGVDAEYTLPSFLPMNLDLGASLRTEFAHVFPKSGGTLKSDDQLNFSLGAWLRLPFLLAGQTFALQPELAYGLVLHHAKGQNGSAVDGWFSDSALSLALGLRYIAPTDSLRNVEFELAPVYMFSPEKENYSVSQLGFRLGAVWHVDSLIKGRKAQKEEKQKAVLAEQQRLERERQEEEARKLKEEEDAKRRAMEAAADEAEKARIAEELRKAEEERMAAEAEAARIAEEERIRAEEEAARIAAEEARRAEIAAWPNPLLTFTASPQNFTPDGDGMNDTVTFTMGIQYIEETPENWAISITDPQGNAFRTIKGKGALPESVEWDGKSDKGETVASKNAYKATLAVTPSRTDRLRTKELTASTDITITTGLLLEVIVPEHEWKMVVNAMQFAGGGATFDGLDEATLATNNETLDEVAQQIKEHPGANVFVQGYANNVSGTEKENREELIPLSQERADFIVEQLVNRGIERETLTAEGKGGANPIASRRDRANWWKNRRIEFLIKK